LLVATHGRALWIFDDLTPVQQLPQARAAGAMLFAPRTTYAFGQHADDEGLYTRFGGKNPPGGVMISFYQATPGAKPPAVVILDARHRIIRTISGATRVDEREIPNVTNDVGLNRVQWDLREDGPVRWDGAARDEYKGPRTGAQVVPGTYVVRMVLGGKTLEQSFTVQQDPRTHFTPAQFADAYAFVKKHQAQYSAVDIALNRIEGIMKSAKARMTGGSNAALDAKLAATMNGAQAVKDLLTADYHNDEDSIQRPGKLREDIQLNAGLPLTVAARAYAARVDAEYAVAMRNVDAFFRSDVASTNTLLKRAGKAPLIERAPSVSDDGDAPDEDTNDPDKDRDSR
jgi:hypothetical protein